MNKLLVILLPVVFLTTLYSCDRKPYVEHKAKLEQLGEDCNRRQEYFRVLSNFGGERYEFEKCLPADFSTAQIITERHGDTVRVKLPVAAATGSTALFKIVLDIDSYPRYQFITIDQDTYTIVPSAN